MSQLNTIVKPEHIDEFRPYFNYFDEINYLRLNYDAIWKWSGLLDSFFRLYGPTPTFGRCIDIGGGHSPIHRLLSNFGHVTNVDQFLFSQDGRPQTWFPLNDNGFFEESPGFKYKPENIEYATSDFLDYIKTVQDNSVCLYVDGCSLIHINPKTDRSHHDGVTEVAEHIFRTLKPGGYLLSCSDIYNPKLKSNYPSILRHDGVTYAETLFDIFRASGLTAVDESDFESSGFFADYGNVVGLDPQAPSYKRLNPCHSCNNHLPDYHAFAQIQDFPMLIARFVFTKA